MGRPASKNPKSEALTIRLDPKTRFILDYMARYKGQTITTVVERAILAAAANTVITRSDGYDDHEITWQNLWDVSEGVRALEVSKVAELIPTFEEERRLAFVRTHWPFFFTGESKRTYLNHYVDVLWPRIDEFIQLHEDMKHEDYFAAGKAMAEALKNAKLQAPKWPVERSTATPEKSAGNFSRDPDDDIPF
ncbi:MULTISPECIES: hypothetical protein [unclassified Rhizobium]|uniref:hypothetical protein n=1 Tax=unclassified Rhizobium TaxID=2613769 RepID=UPI0007E955E3|nr:MULTISPECIES: hypothetical protein [unclassified Rhizobium]ANM10376.1 hypothetical protein AMK05_CH01990 [Rhizobium sp. N324]ANM16861.1 hypothetical protein AMK06_CH01959 [Rhizobium sp. N541]ANM23246.1 hypothetical protein AMK07_CH01956 [Rhizobium sp. N941]